MENDSFFDFLNENRPLISPTGKGETESPDSRDNIIPNERTAFLLFPIFIELIHQFKSTLTQIGKLAQMSRDKFNDKKYGDYFNRTVTQDIEKVDLVLNGLLNYIKVNTAIRKINTVHSLIEEVIEKNKAQLEEKRIKLLKKFEKNLPEIVVPDEQLRYILNSVLKYAVTSVPPRESIGFLTKSFLFQKQSAEDHGLFEKDGKYVEILIIFTGYKIEIEPIETGSRRLPPQREKVLDIALRLVDEVVHRNRGIMRFEVDEKKSVAYISLKFPVERRNVVYFQKTDELTSSVSKSKSTFEKLSSLEEMKKRG